MVLVPYFVISSATFIFYAVVCWGSSMKVPGVPVRLWVIELDPRCCPNHPSHPLHSDLVGAHLVRDW